MRLLKIETKAMNSKIYNHDPILWVFMILGLFINFSSLNKSDLASKIMKIIEMNDVNGKAAKNDK